MPKGGFGGMPGGNMQSMMKQMQKMQSKMLAAQEEAEQRVLEASSGGGAVKVVITGKKQITELTINPEVIDPDDPEMLQDLIMTAVNEAIRQAEEMMANELGKFAPGGLPF